MEVHAATLALGWQLLVSGGLVLVLVVIHSIGLLGIGHFLHLDPAALKRRSLDMRAIVTMASLGFLLFALHILEIMLFAVFYLAVDIFRHFDDALFYSASAYTTLGLTANFPEGWRMIGAFEALIGFVLIGWSTAFVIGTMDRLRS